MRPKKKEIRILPNTFSNKKAMTIIVEGMICLLHKKLDTEAFTDFVERNKIEYEIKEK